MKKQALSILVISCDRYADIWDTFLYLFNKYWPDCEYNIYLGSNYKISNNPRVIPICIGEDSSWAENTKKMLEKIPSDYVLLMLEDFFIDKRIDQRRISLILDYAEQNNIDCVRLRPFPPPFRTINRKLKIGIIEENEPYYVTTQPSIWRKSALIELLVNGYSAWDFELKNSHRNFGGRYQFVSTNDQLISIQNGVRQGKYYSSTVSFFKKEKIDVDFSERGILDNSTIKQKMKDWFYTVREWLYVKLRLYQYRKKSEDNK